MNDDSIQRGDWVKYDFMFPDGIGIGLETGYGELEAIDEEREMFLIRNGDRLIEAPWSRCAITLHAKQYRLEV